VLNVIIERIINIRVLLYHIFLFMGLLIILIVTDILTILVLQEHFYHFSKAKYFLSIIIHVILSLAVWITFIELDSFRGFFDSPQHVWLMMNMTGLIVAVVIPRVLLDILHFTGKLVRIRKGDHLRFLTNAGLMIIIVFPYNNLVSVPFTGDLISKQKRSQ